MGIVTQPPEVRPALSADSRLKVHLRLLAVRGYTYRLITLRPETKIAFSTNFYHQTWHLVSSQRGARLLARLLWGLSFQRRPGTLVLVHGEHLLPTPFEAERSDPFLLVPAGLTRLDGATLRVLKQPLPRLGPPTRTIRWQTFGLDVALKQGSEYGSDRGTVAHAEGYWGGEERGLWQQEQMLRRGGFLCYSAPPPVLRQQALRIHALRVRQGDDACAMDYHFLAQSSSRRSWWGDGEVQIFADYMDRVTAAAEARQELLPNPRQPILSEMMQEMVSRRRDQLKGRRRGRLRLRGAARDRGSAE